MIRITVFFFQRKINSEAASEGLLGRHRDLRPRWSRSVAVGNTALDVAHREVAENSCILMSFTFVSICIFIFFFVQAPEKLHVVRSWEERAAGEEACTETWLDRSAWMNAAKRSVPHLDPNWNLQLNCSYLPLQPPLYLIKCWFCFDKIMKTKWSVSIYRH